MKTVSILYDELEDRYLWWVLDGPHGMSEGENRDMATAFEEAREAFARA